MLLKNAILLRRSKMKSFKEQANLDEAPLVMKDLDMVKTLFHKIETDLSKNIRSKKPEKNWPILKQLADIAGYGITKKGQASGKSFRYDLKK